MSSQPQRSEEQSSTTEPPAQIEPDQLPRALFGYERSAIVELLDTMSARVRELTHERAEHERRITELEQELGRNRETQLLIGETLVHAREEAAAIREEAQRSAGRELDAARERAEQIIAEAEQAATARVAAMIAAGQEQRDSIVAEARHEQQEVFDEAGRARAFVDTTHEQLSDFLMAAVRWYEQARPSAERALQTSGDEPDSPAKDSSSIPSSLSAALTRESQSTSSSTGRSDE